MRRVLYLDFSKEIHVLNAIQRAYLQIFRLRLFVYFSSHKQVLLYSMRRAFVTEITDLQWYRNQTSYTLLCMNMSYSRLLLTQWCTNLDWPMFFFLPPWNTHYICILTCWMKIQNIYIYGKCNLLYSVLNILNDSSRFVRETDTIENDLTPLGVR